MTFSRRTGVPVARLAYWRRRVSFPEATPTNFVAVDLAGVGARQLEIVAFGVVVRVREALDADRVAHLSACALGHDPAKTALNLAA